MSKYEKLWEYIISENKDSLKLSYKQIEEIVGLALDHSFLKYKKELLEYGFEVKKISMKEESVLFVKSQGGR